MSRVLAFFLGMIFGIVFLLGSLGLGVYLAVTKVTPADISQETAVLGDLANMSLLDIYKDLSTLYSQKIGVADQNGKYYSLGDLCTQYNIDSQNLFGVSLSDDLLEVPVFEFFSTSTDSQGNNGVQRALKQIKVSAIPSLLNLFVKNEDGSAIVNDNVMEELSNYNIVELMTKEQGIAYVFENITFSQLLPENFPSDPNGDNALMWAVGQSSVGKLYTALGSNDSLFLQLKEGGALETLGQMEVTDLLGSEAGTLSSLFGDTLVVDLVGENGEINVDDIINYTYVGSLLGCIRNEITDVSGYHVLASSPNGDVLYGIIDGKDSLVKEEDGKYYEAELTCTEQHDVHGYDCYGFVWYNSSVLPSDHPCTPDEELIKDGLHHSKVSSLYGAFVNLRIADITGGSFDAILDKVKNLTISEIVNGEVSGILANFADMTVGELLDGGLEKMYLGNFLGYTRTQTDATQVTGVATLDDGTKVGFANGNTVMSDDGETWYLAKSVCEQQHPHTRDCYIYIWMNGNAQADGVMAKLADKKINSLGDISAMLQDFTLADVLGEDNLTGIFRELANVPIGDIANQIDSIYIGTVLEYSRKQIEDVNGYTQVVGTTNVMEKQGKFVKSDDGEVWYEAQLDCETDHVHTDACYGYVWYSDETCVQAVSGLEAMLSNATINTIGDRLKLENFTLAKLGIGDDNNILAYLQDVPLSEIDTQLNTMKLGVALGYTLNNENVWVDGEGNPVKGINAKIAEMSIQDFGSGNGITAITDTLTIGDLMDSGMIVLDKDKEYKLNIIFCNDNEQSFTENGLVPYTYHCNIVDFITYQNNGHENATAEAFYYKFTHDSECAAQWQNMRLTEFVDSLLNAF